MVSKQIPSAVGLVKKALVAPLHAFDMDINGNCSDFEDVEDEGIDWDVEPEGIDSGSDEDDRGPSLDEPSPVQADFFAIPKDASINPRISARYPPTTEQLIKQRSLTLDSLFAFALTCRVGVSLRSRYTQLLLLPLASQTES